LKSIAEKLISFFGRNPGIIYLFAVVVWVLTFAAKLLYNGLIFGFDYGLFHPDGALYSFRALLWSGHSENEAGRLVGEWYRSNSFNAQYQGPELYYKNNAFLWDQYSGRILYPLLSVPFVKLFGVGGMLVAPAATMLFVLLVTSRIALNLKVPAIGYLAIILISLSTSIQRWMFANITDGLLLLFVSIFALLVQRRSNLNLTRIDHVILSITIIGSSLTRFSALIWISVALVFLAHKKFFTSFLIGSLALLGMAPIFLRPFSGHVLPGYGDKSLIEKIFIYPINLVKVTVFELGQLYVLDRAFFVFLLFCIYLAVVYRHQNSSKFFLAVLVAVWLTGAINGVLGVNFRYQLPVVPLLLWAFIETFPKFLTRLRNYSD
jgi:hypothetical protein